MKNPIIYVVLSVILLVFLLSGCIEVDVKTGIDADFTAYLSYHIKLDISESDPHITEFTNTLHRIGWHYQEELGFSVQLYIDAPPYELIMTQRVENNSLEQAFQSLEDMLTDEAMTPFMHVDMFIDSFQMQTRYRISAMIDVPQVIQLSNVVDMPTDFLPDIAEIMETAGGSVTLEFPASEFVDATHQANTLNNQVVMVVPLEFTGQTELELTAQLNFLDDGTVGGTLDDIIRDIDELRTFAIIACGAALLLLLIAVVLIIVKIRRRKKYRSRTPMELSQQQDTTSDSLH